MSGNRILPAGGGGGGGGTTIANDPIWTTKGQVAGATGAAAAVALAVGANGKVLTADSTQPSGLAWSDAPGMYPWQNNASIAGSAFRGLPGWVAVGAGGGGPALSQYDVYTIPFFVRQPITITGWDMFVGSGNSAGAVFRAGVYSPGASAFDLYDVGSLVEDFGTVSVATIGAKALTGLSRVCASGWHVLAFGSDAPALSCYGPQVAPLATSAIDTGAGTSGIYGLARWWFDYNAGSSPPTTGLPATLTGSSQHGLGVSNDAPRLPISLRYTCP